MTACAGDDDDGDAGFDEALSRAIDAIDETGGCVCASASSGGPNQVDRMDVSQILTQPDGEQIKHTPEFEFAAMAKDIGMVRLKPSA